MNSIGTILDAIATSISQVKSFIVAVSYVVIDTIEITFH